MHEEITDLESKWILIKFIGYRYFIYSIYGSRELERESCDAFMLSFLGF